VRSRFDHLEGSATCRNRDKPGKNFDDASFRLLGVFASYLPGWMGILNIIIGKSHGGHKVVGIKWWVGSAPVLAQKPNQNSTAVLCLVEWLNE
jgi:hypothetical protein